MTWTDERIDDFSKRVEHDFALVRDDMKLGFERVDKRFERLENRMAEGFSRVDSDLRELRNWFIGGFGTMIAGFIALFLHGG